MEYEGQICRSPMERSSFMLPVMVGCSYNRCKFCMLFKHLTYRRLPMEQIFADIRRVADLGGDPKWVFLGDGNAFSLPAEDLLTILQEIRWAFPSCQGVNMDATVTSIAQKNDEQLRLLAQAGVSHLYLGIESGLDDVLRLMDKDHTKAQAMEQIRRITESLPGIDCGACGSPKCRAFAEDIVAGRAEAGMCVFSDKNDKDK